MIIFSGPRVAGDFKALAASRFRAIGRPGIISGILRPAGIVPGGPGSSEAV
jgi:hypothetical protein